MNINTIITKLPKEVQLNIIHNLITVYVKENNDHICLRDLSQLLKKHGYITSNKNEENFDKQVHDFVTQKMNKVSYKGKRNTIIYDLNSVSAKKVLKKVTAKSGLPGCMLADFKKITTERKIFNKNMHLYKMKVLRAVKVKVLRLFLQKQKKIGKAVILLKDLSKLKN